MTQTLTPSQAKFRERAKVALLRRRLSVKALAAAMGRPRSSVSRAINSGSYPRLRVAIATALDL